jgi:hypothetical protein
MTEYSVNRSSSVHRVEFKGNLTVCGCGNSRDVLLQVLGEHDAVAIDCAEATQVDLTFVQTILSAKRFAETAGVELSLAHPAGGPLLSVLQRAGFVAAPGEQPVAGQSFWLGQPTDDSAQQPQRT